MLKLVFTAALLAACAPAALAQSVPNSGAAVAPTVQSEQGRVLGGALSDSADGALQDRRDRPQDQARAEEQRRDHPRQAPSAAAPRQGEVPPR